MRRTKQVFIFTVIFLSCLVGLLSNLDKILPQDVVEAIKQRMHNGKPWYGLCDTAYAATTVEEFRQQIEKDPELKRHYKNFNWEEAYTFAMPEEKSMHVSYRTPTSIFWTSKKIKIKKGETLITDGIIVVRTFCCNQIADWPKGPTLVDHKEPEERDLQPEESPTGPPKVTPPDDPFIQVPPTGPPITPFAPFGPFCPLCGSTPPREPTCEDFDENDPDRPLPCICGDHPQGDPDRPEECDEIGVPPEEPPCCDAPPLDPVPEPNTWLLFGTGLVLLFILTRRKRNGVNH